MPPTRILGPRVTQRGQPEKVEDATPRLPLVLDDVLRGERQRGRSGREPVNLEEPLGVLCSELRLGLGLAAVEATATRLVPTVDYAALAARTKDTWAAGVKKKKLVGADSLPGKTPQCQSSTFARTTNTLLPARSAPRVWRFPNLGS